MKINSKLAIRAKNMSVLKKLTLSYLVLIILLATSIGFTSYILSSKNYNNEVVKLNQQLLSQYSSTIHQTIVKTTDETRKKMVLDVNMKTDIDILFEQNISISKIPTLYNDLNKLVNASGNLYQGIHIYSKDNNLVLSSILGLKYLDKVTPYSWSNLIWVTQVPSINDTSYWMPTHEVSYTTTDHNNVISYIASYPSTASFTDPDIKGFIRFDINENYLMNILTNIDIGGKGELFLIDNRGGMVAHSDGIVIPSTIYDLGYPSLEFFSDDTTNDSPLLIDGVENMVSYIPIGDYWKLVRSVPINDFYSVTNKIAFTTTAICIGAVIAAMLIALMFASNIYSPLKVLTSKIKRTSSLSKGQKSIFNNEYAIISDAIINYDSQITSLNKKWQDNIINLKQNLLRNIISNTIHSEKDFNKGMQLVGQDNAQGEYNILLINVIDTELTDLIAKDLDRAIKNLVIYTENLSNSSNIIIASELTNNIIVALVISKNQEIHDYLKKIIAFASKSLFVDIDISVGAWKKSSIETYNSFNEASTAYKYKFFMPQMNIFDFNDMNFIDTNTQTSSFKKIYSQYSQSLISDDEIKAQVQISTLVENISALKTQLHHRYECLETMTMVLANYIDKYYIGDSDIELNIHNLQDHFSDIYDYEKWLTQATYHLLELKKSQSDRKIDDIIFNIKRYISENLAKDLSLTRLSEYTTLSNCYLSHIFKESTGTNVVDYITQQRMIRAKTLLETTALNIELVASTCGYITPHYFSKKFKQYFGLTPRSYRIAYGEKQSNSIV